MKQDTKRAILQATIRLLEAPDSRLMDTPVRDICKAAGTSVSQINYHFQTKENLIAQCVQVMSGDTIKKFGEVSAAVKRPTAQEKLKRLLEINLDFLFKNENISRISILTDHQNPGDDDNTAQTIRAYLPLVVGALAERGLRRDPLMVTSTMIFGIQVAFLRAERIRKEAGVNLRFENDARQWLSDYVDQLFGNAP